MTPPCGLPRRRTTPRATAVLVGLLLAASLSACGDDDTVAVGDVVAASREPDASAPVASVVVPTGTLEVRVSQAREMEPFEAPGGATLVRVSTTFLDAEVRRDVWAFAARLGAAEPIELAVRVGDTAYPVGVVRRGNAREDAAVQTVPGDLVLAVDGELEDLDDVSVEVTYDGLTQVVDGAGEVEPGLAAPLYDEVADATELPTEPCRGGLDDPAITGDVECEVGVVRSLPYLPDLGWAEEGRTWTVVAVRGQLAAAGSRGSAQVSAGRYAVSSFADATTLDGDEPAAVLDQEVLGEGTRSSAQLVFDTAVGSAGRLDVLRRYTLALQSVDDGPASPPAARRVVYTASVDLAGLQPDG